MKKQKDGRYRAKLAIGHDKSGKAVYKWASGKTKRELEDAKEEIKRAYITGNAGAKRSILAFEYIENWYALYKRENVGQSQRNNYATAINKYILPVIGEKQMRAVTSFDLQRIMFGMSGMGKSTIGNVHAVLSNVFKLATAQGIIDRDPAYGLAKPNTTSKPRRALTDNETNAVLAVADEKNDLLLYILYYTGMRVGEVLALLWRDINFDAHYISIAKDVDFKTGKIGTPKTGASFREVPIPDALYEILITQRGELKSYVYPSPIGKHITKSTYERIWARLMVAAYEHDHTIECEDVTRQLQRKTGPILGSILTAHYFRHNYATMLYTAGVDLLSAQRWLGHSEISTTLGIYTDLQKKKESVSIDALGKHFKGAFAPK